MGPPGFTFHSFSCHKNPNALRKFGGRFYVCGKPTGLDASVSLCAQADLMDGSESHKAKSKGQPLNSNFWYFEFDLFEFGPPGGEKYTITIEAVGVPSPLRQMEILVQDHDDTAARPDNPCDPTLQTRLRHLLTVIGPSPNDSFSAAMGVAKGTATDLSSVSGDIVYEANSSRVSGTPGTSGSNWTLSGFQWAELGPSFLIVSGDTSTILVPITVVV
jgi:hypothetical protein